MTTHLSPSLQTSGFGSWRSPISTDLIIKDAISLDEISLYNGEAYWIEKRPMESGRCVIVRYNGKSIIDCLPATFSTRSKVHEYGGASYIVGKFGIFFINEANQQIYHTEISDKAVNSIPKQITSSEQCRFTDMVFDGKHNQIICICEDHSSATTEPVNTLVSINIDDGNKTTLASGSDFYSNPVLCPKSHKLAWLCWNHPNMPWDGTELWGAELSKNSIAAQQHITGNKGVSICQPRWSPQGILTFVSDESGWWNLYQYHNQAIHNLYKKSAEFGSPQWVFGQSSYQFVDGNTIQCIVTENATDSLATIHIAESTIQLHELPLTTLSSLQCNNTKTWVIASSSTCSPQVTEIDNAQLSINSIKSSYVIDIDSAYLSSGHNIEYITRHNDKAHAIYYPPCNKDYKSTGLPPLIVTCHGGPTGCSSNAFDIRKQFWTSRGFAILDVNYSGSTGYGRKYRERLNKSWGIREVEDCCDAALYAVENKLANPDQLIIKGGSAGGYSVLCALTFHDVFSAGASYYGIGELATLATDTHKFESRYLDNLIGAYPEEKTTYRERSPLHHVDQLNCPVIFFQGEEDMVVPKLQAEEMVAAIDEKGLPVAYLLFEGEGHGFRKSETIKRTLNAEYLFYSKIFNFNVTEKLESILIKNL